MIGPTGVFVIDSKQWTGRVHQGGDGLAWHNHYRLDRTLETVRWEADTISRILGTRAAPLLCVHGAHVHGSGLHAQGVARARSARWSGLRSAPATPCSGTPRPRPRCRASSREGDGLVAAPTARSPRERRPAPVRDRPWWSTSPPD